MKKIAVLFCVVFSFSVGLSAQTRVAQRTITNADLQRFEQQRLAAARDYQATYAQRGMLSPEEVDRLNDQRKREMLDLAARLEWANLERDRLNTESELRRYPGRVFPGYQMPSYGYGYGGGAFYSDGYGGYFGNPYDYGNGRGRRFYGQGYFPWYAAGGNVWYNSPGGGPRAPLPPPVRSAVGRPGPRH